MLHVLRIFLVITIQFNLIQSQFFQLKLLLLYFLSIKQPDYGFVMWNVKLKQMY